MTTTNEVTTTTSEVVSTTKSETITTVEETATITTVEETATITIVEETATSLEQGNRTTTTKPDTTMPSPVIITFTMMGGMFDIDI